MELLIRVVDKVHPTDVDKNRQLTKRGDVIAIRPDGWNWGTKELSNPEWRIISVPSMTAKQEADLLESEDPFVVPNARKRMRHLDLDDVLLGVDTKALLLDNSRTTKLVEEPLLLSTVRTKV